MVSAVSAAPLLTQQQAAELLGIAPQTLSVWRCTNRYPLPYVRAGRAVRYRPSDVQEFIERRTVRPQGEIA